MGHVFVSYSHKDTKYAHKLAEDLQNNGVNVWIDERLDYGSQWPHEIQRQLDSCDAFILIMSPNSYSSEWVQSELQRAKRKRKPIFPLLLEGNEPWLSVESTQYYDVRGEKKPDARFYSAIKRVISISKAAPAYEPSTRSSSAKSNLIVWALAAVIGIVVLVGVAILGFWIIGNLPPSTTPATATKADMQVYTPTSVTGVELTMRAQQTSAALAATDTGAMAQQQTATAVWLNADDDGDGLTNDREVKLGTRPDVRDTDGDGLDDGPEVNTLFTDPLDPDTDGDGQIDSQDDTPRIPSTATPDVAATAAAEACFVGDWGPVEYAGELTLLQINRISKEKYSFRGTGGCAANCDWGVIDVLSNWPRLAGIFPTTKFSGAVKVEVECIGGDQLQATITENASSGTGVVTPNIYNVTLKKCASITFGWSCSFE